MAHALDLVGERWTLLIVRELLVGPRRYGQLLDNLAGIGTNLLAARLRDLESRAIVEKDGPRYVLTETGRLLEPVIWELIRFGVALGVGDDPRRLTRREWDVVALRALYRPADDAGLDGRYVLELDDQPFCIEKIGGDVRVTQGDCADPRVRIGLTKGTARDLAAGKMSLKAATHAGAIAVAGPKREAEKLLRAFGILD